MRDLLGSADRPRELTPGERERLLARLGADASRTETDHGLVTVTSADDAQRRGRGVARPWLAAAATVLAIVAGVTFLARDRAVAPATDPADTIRVPAAPSASWCSERLDPLVDALRRWRGVENWAWAGGVPDVGGLAVDALSDPPTGVDDALGRRAGQVATALVSEIAAIDPATEQRVAAAARTTAVEPALVVIAQLAEDPAASCPPASVAELRG